MIKGLSLPYYARYSFVGGDIVYSNGGSVGKAVRYATDFNISEDSDYYGDNGKAETEQGKFIDGTLTLETTHLSQALSKTLFGLKEKTVTVDTTDVKMNVYDEDAKSPYLGFGIIEWHQVDNVDHYRAVVLLRTVFNISANAATTKGESVDWQTREIQGKIERTQLNNATEKYPWMYEAWLDTEAKALAVLRSVLNVYDANLASLQVGTLELDPGFMEDVYEYAVATSNATDIIYVIPKDGNATIEILNDATPVVNGEAATWVSGANTVTVTVTNGDVSKTYTITVTYTPEA